MSADKQYENIALQILHNGKVAVYARYFINMHNIASFYPKLTLIQVKRIIDLRMFKQL